MTVSFWRIGTDTPDYTADDLTGAGARITGGRWNRTGTAVVYCSSTRALACLETIVHVRGGPLPLNRYLVRIDIPDGIWSSAVVLTAATAPIGWDALPEGKASLDAGERWISRNAAAVMLVPSIIVPEEQNALISPAHPDAGSISALKVRRWLYDPRLSSQ